MKVITLYFKMENEDKFLDILKILDSLKYKYKAFDKYVILLDNDMTKPFILIEKIKKAKLNKYINDIIIVNGELNSSVKQILNEGD